MKYALLFLLPDGSKYFTIHLLSLHQPSTGQTINLIESL